MTEEQSALALQSLRAAYDLLLRDRDHLALERVRLRAELTEVDAKRSRLLADCRDLERENAALRRRLREGGR